MDEMRYFTIQQAQRALVYIRPILLEIQIAYRTFLELESNVRERESFTVAERNGLIDHLNNVREQIDRLTNEITATGAEIKDFASGLCDFPYRRASGEVVQLCYRLGEDAVRSWHTLDEGVAGRRSLVELIEEERSAPLRRE